jgi:hypothetical protein
VVRPMQVCEQLHSWANRLAVYRYPFDRSAIPANGLYILFERGETGHGTNRIVRIGTHTGDGQLPSRLCQHFVKENKDRSIFRKNVGRALLNRDHDPFLPFWQLDLTTRRMKAEHADIDRKRQLEIEHAVSTYMRGNFSFVVLRVDDKADRLRLESKMISTVSNCEVCQPSATWLGLSSPVKKIQESGLWLVNELYREVMTEGDLRGLETLEADAAFKSLDERNQA